MENKTVRILFPLLFTISLIITILLAPLFIIVSSLIYMFKWLI